MKIEVRKPVETEIEEMNILSWPIWTCEPSEFDWCYDERETCFLLEGNVTVTMDSGSVSFGIGDLVIFPAGLSCRWKVNQTVRKHYKFG
ncbi:MAG: cupin domain-containing protein [Candidatus Fermentibacteraceae bacterium]|nr:cupin domain-containing protein [Candidatus Fermentibacteraceae bacterium]